MAKNVTIFYHNHLVTTITTQIVGVAINEGLP